MKILVTGANGNLGRLITLHLLTKQFEVIQASSRPGPGQYFLDFESEEYFGSPRTDLLIHVARATNAHAVENEIKFLSAIFGSGAQVISIGSMSEFMIKKSTYGVLKSRVSDFVTANGGTVLSCGLISGKSFSGQLTQIARVLNFLPFVPQLKSPAVQFITQIESIFSAIELVIGQENYGKRFLVVEDEGDVMFNEILLRLCEGWKPKIYFGNRITYLGAFLAEILGLHYFSRDSLKGLLGEYDFAKIEQLPRI